MLGKKAFASRRKRGRRPGNCKASGWLRLRIYGVLVDWLGSVCKTSGWSSKSGMREVVRGIDRTCSSRGLREAKLNEGTVVLREAVRQQGDGDFAKVLNEMRVGVVTEKAKHMLASCHAPGLSIKKEVLRDSLESFHVIRYSLSVP